MATKFSRTTERFFAEKGVNIEVIPLKGAIELAPATGLADVIVDIVSTGRTLKENNLCILEEIYETTARLGRQQGQLWNQIGADKGHGGQNISPVFQGRRGRSLR